MYQQGESDMAGFIAACESMRLGHRVRRDEWDASVHLVWDSGQNSDRFILTHSNGYEDVYHVTMDDVMMDDWHSL